MSAATLWSDGQWFFNRHLACAALDRFLLLTAQPGADLARAWNAAGLAAMKVKDFPRAGEYLRRALAEGRSAGSDPDVLRALVNLTLLDARTGDVSDALGSAAEADALYIQVGDPSLRAIGLLNGAFAYGLDQQWDEAIRRGRAALEAIETVPDPVVLPWVYHNLGAALLEVGEVAEARTALMTATELAHGIGNAAVLAHSYTELARLCLREGDWAGTIGFGRQSIHHLWNNLIDVDNAAVARLCELFGRMALATDENRLGGVLMERATTYYALLGLWKDWSRVTELIRSGGVGRLVKVADLPEGCMDTLQYFADLFGLLDTIEGANPALVAHSQLATHYAICLAVHLGLNHDQISLLSHAGRLCDIGLTAFDAATTADHEGPRYRMHPDLSARWLLDFPMPDGTADVVRHHHERYDGHGYPGGLKGEEIPFGSRLLAVCEAYVCALAAGSAHDDAMAGVQAAAGHSLDPTMVEAFIQLHQIPR